MAKRKILVIIFILVLSVSLCAYSSEKETSESREENTVSYSNEITVSSGGTYFFFRSDSQKNMSIFLKV